MKTKIMWEHQQSYGDLENTHYYLEKDMSQKKPFTYVLGSQSVRLTYQEAEILLTHLSFFIKPSQSEDQSE